MYPMVPKIRNLLATVFSSDRLKTPRKTRAGTWMKASIVGIIFGVLAQILRQIPGDFMYLGASTAPWVMVGFLLSISASRGTRTPRNAIIIATGTVASYLLAWLVAYHLLFVIRESVSLVDGWRQLAPWLVATVPVSPILGTIAALSHKHGILGDVCLATPIALSLAEALKSLEEGWLVAASIAVLAVLLVYMVRGERRIRLITLVVTIVVLGVLGVALFPILWVLVLGRF